MSRRYWRSFQNNSTGRVVPEILVHVAASDRSDDKRLSMARRLFRDGASIKSIAEQLDFNSSVAARNYLAAHGMKRDYRFAARGRPNTLKEARELSDAPPMGWEEFKKQMEDKSLTRRADQNSEPRVHITTPNGMKVSYPAWHDEARQMKKDGKSALEISNRFKMSPSRISQIISDNWLAYVMRERTSMKNRKSVAEYVEIIKAAQPEKKEGELSDRQFDKYKSADPGDHRHGVKITCGNAACPHGKNGRPKMFAFMKQGSINPVHAAQYFRNNGWSVGGGPRADRCPECSNGIGRYEPKKEDHPIPVSGVVLPNDTAPIQPPNVPEPKPEPVREMTLQDRRILMLELNVAYSDDGKGYKKGKSDEVVATSLGVPVEWVRKMREENFGPEGDPDEEKARAELKTMLAEIKAIQVEIDAIIEKYDEKIVIFDEKVKALEIIAAKLK